MDAWDPNEMHIGQARCAGCGLVMAQPQATDDELTVYYADAYYEQHYVDPDAHWSDNVRDYERYEIPLIERLWSGFEPPAGGSLAEFGCGRGSLLTTMKARGFRVKGCDLSTSAVAFCRSKGLDVVEGPDVAGDEAFDCVVAFQVIEHVTDPRAFMRRMVERTKPGGIIVVTTESIWTTQYAIARATAWMRGRIPPYRTSNHHTFVFEGSHLQRLLREEGCDVARSAPYRRMPQTGSLHFRVFKESCRAIDQVLGLGEYLAAVGRRRP
jgi:2-polyprenyl-3-methyl-5-hydroxy-6-metoxy-1,4-benzoquinol methylase